MGINGIDVLIGDDDNAFRATDQDSPTYIGSEVSVDICPDCSGLLDNDFCPECDV